MTKRTIFLFSIIIFYLSINNCHALKISEIFPNPVGKDTKNEWIEIYNPENQIIDLLNWTIRNDNKSQIIKKNISIQPHTFYVLEYPELKLSVKNSNTFIELIDPLNQSTDKIEYQYAPEGLSLARVMVTKDNQQKIIENWSTPTKLNKNPILKIFSGTIIKEPYIEKEYQFDILTNDEIKTITFYEQQYEYQYLKNILPLDSNVEILVDKKGDDLILQNFRILSQATEKLQSKIKTQSQNISDYSEEFWRIYLLIPVIAGVIFLTAQTISAPKPP